jgi:hypothetical protein
VGFPHAVLFTAVAVFFEVTNWNLKFLAMDKLERVEIIWFDAWFQPSEMTYEEAEDLGIITRQNIGYLLKQDSDAVILASGKLEKIPGGQDSFCDFVIIPTSVVAKIIPLGEK